MIKIQEWIEYKNDVDDIYKILKNTIQTTKANYSLLLMIWFMEYFVIKNLIQ